MKSTKSVPSPFQTALPKTLKAGRDRLLLRLDFYSESIVMQTFEDAEGSFRTVSAHDIVRAMSSQISFGTGILPENALWWRTTSQGPQVALWLEPHIRKLALQAKADAPAVRYEAPLPGLVFLCRPGQEPWIYAASHRPAASKDRLYKAPLSNVFQDGRSCRGTVSYPADVGEIPETFFKSFFTRAGDVSPNKSKKHPDDITKMWAELSKAKAQKYPLDDLYYHGTVADLLEMR